MSLLKCLNGPLSSFWECSIFIKTFIKILRTLDNELSELNRYDPWSPTHIKFITKKNTEPLIECLYRLNNYH